MKVLYFLTGLIFYDKSYFYVIFLLCLINLPKLYLKTRRGCASRSPEASETQLGRVKAICDLARLASGIIVVISVFNLLLNNVFLFVYGMVRSHGVLVCVRYYTRCLTHKLQQCLQTRTNTQQTIRNYNVRYHPLSTTP